MHVRIDKTNQHGSTPPSSETLRGFNNGFSGVTYKQMRAYEDMYPPLEETELVRLVRLAQAGSEEAMEKIIKHNSRKIMLFAIQAYTGRRKNGKPGGWGTANAGVLSMDECIAVVTSAIFEATMKFKEGTYSPVAQAPVRFSSWVNLIVLQRVSAVLRAAKNQLDRYADEDAGERCVLPEHHRLVEASPEEAFARERFWDVVTRIVGKDGRRVLEEWPSKTTPGERAKLRKAYNAVIRKIQEKANPQELEALRKVLS